MEYEIYVNDVGNRRVNIGDFSFALEVRRGDTTQWNVASPWEGPIEKAGSPVLRAWLLAAQEVGVPLRYAWTGVINSLGHTGGHRPPWNPKPRDWRRAPVAA